MIRTLHDIEDIAICLVVLVTAGKLGKNATTEDATIYFNHMGTDCERCDSHKGCALCKREE